MIIVTSSFRKAPFLKCTFSVKQEHEKPAFSNSSSDLKGTFEKLRFRDVLVWIVGLTVELKLRFQFLLHRVDGPKKRSPGFMYIFVTNNDCITLILKRRLWPNDEDSSCFNDEKTILGFHKS